MKIKINNETDYDTSWLRQLLNRAIRMVNRRMKRKHILRDKYRVDIVYKNSVSTWTGGYAYYSNNYVRLQVIRPPQAMKYKKRYDIEYFMINSTKEEVEEMKEKEKQWNLEQKEDRQKAMEGIALAVTKTMVHELYHCYGYKHEDGIMFAPRKKVWVENTYNYDWCSKYPVQYKIEKPELIKPKTDIQMKRYLRILDLLKDKQSKIKRLQNQIKKYFSRKHYYEKILVSAGKITKD
ncbi:hypothetical protein MUP35_04410 [Patescibacteria group bacterium]|nr:hypothetical protein [Patescibacteria group bacterium]